MSKQNTTHPNVELITKLQEKFGDLNFNVEAGISDRYIMVGYTFQDRRRYSTCYDTPNKAEILITQISMEILPISVTLIDSIHHMVDSHTHRTVYNTVFDQLKGCLQKLCYINLPYVYDLVDDHKELYNFIPVPPRELTRFYKLKWEI